MILHAYVLCGYTTLIESWESSVVVTIRPLCKWYHTWLCHADWCTLVWRSCWRVFMEEGESNMWWGLTHRLPCERRQNNQRGVISTLKGGSLKLVDKFTYLGNSVSSSENDITTRLAKAWRACDWSSVIKKSDLSDKIKRSFFSNGGRVYTTIWMHHMDAD